MKTEDSESRQTTQAAVEHVPELAILESLVRRFPGGEGGSSRDPCALKYRSRTGSGSRRSVRTRSRSASPAVADNDRRSYAEGWTTARCGRSRGPGIGPATGAPRGRPPEPGLPPARGCRPASAHTGTRHLRARPATPRHLRRLRAYPNRRPAASGRAFMIPRQLQLAPAVGRLDASGQMLHRVADSDKSPGTRCTDRDDLGKVRSLRATSPSVCSARSVVTAERIRATNRERTGWSAATRSLSLHTLAWSEHAMRNVSPRILAPDRRGGGRHLDGIAVPGQPRSRSR